MRRHGGKTTPVSRAYWNHNHTATLPAHVQSLHAALAACYAADPSASSVEVLRYFEARGLGRLLGRDTCQRRNSLHDLIHSTHGKRVREEAANAR